jgi:glyoxylase-like metal-dependent hydrolase (beta-lactamase superfamily II)
VIIALNVEKITNGPFQENAYVIWNNTHSFIIDPGGDTKRIIDVIQSNDLSPSAILNTHAHLDHIGAISALIEYGNYPFYLHRNEIDLLNDANEYTSLFAMPHIIIPTVNNIIDSTTPLEFDGCRIEVFETPGHTSGGVSFLIEGHLFTGDTLFAGSIGRTDLPGGNLKILLHSIHNKLLALDDFTIVHSGHGKETTIGTERLNNPFLQNEYS